MTKKPLKMKVIKLQGKALEIYRNETAEERYLDGMIERIRSEMGFLRLDYTAKRYDRNPDYLDDMLNAIVRAVEDFRRDRRELRALRKDIQERPHEQYKKKV